MSTLCITVTSYIPPSGDCVLLWRLLHETRRLTVVVPLIIINYIDIWAAPGHVGETHQVCLHQILPGYWARNFYWLFHKYNLWIWDYELWNWVSLKTMQILKTRISGPDGPLILAVDLRNTPKGCPMGPLF